MIALEKDEQIAVNKAYIEAGHANGIKVVASTGAYRTKDVVEMSQAAEADGADGIMAVTPWYMGPNKQELYDHYKTIHNSINIPVMMYHNPYYSTVLLDDRFIAKLYNEGCIDAIKERQADVFRQQNLRRLTDENFNIFYGYDVCAVETMSCWSDGWVVGRQPLPERELHGLPPRAGQEDRRGDEGSGRAGMAVPAAVHRSRLQRRRAVAADHQGRSEAARRRRRLLPQARHFRAAQRRI